MSIRSIQAPDAVVMVRPHRFHPNPEPAADKAFQRSAGHTSATAVALPARDEVTAAAAALREAGVRVHVFDDHGERETPDSVFPNNWFSTHRSGHVALYPMPSKNRRRERRADVIEMLKAEYGVQDVIDYSDLEHDGLFLEGTGAMVLDHIANVAYTARSRRADPVALERSCTHFNFEPMASTTADAAGLPIYQTNMMMCVATEFALVGFDLMDDPKRRANVRARLEESGRTVIALDARPIADFAGYTIELSGALGRALALSERTAASLTPQQRALITRSARLLPLSVPTIEMAGGPVRCMIAGIHLARR
jgi:hypothetical protein